MPSYGRVWSSSLRVVDLEKAIERVGRRRNAGGRERPRDEGRRALADHAADLVLAAAAPRTTRAARWPIGEVVQRIDERAVQIEDEETNAHSVYSAYEVGVSQTLTRTTGSPCWLACRR